MYIYSILDKKLSLNLVFRRGYAHIGSAFRGERNEQLQPFVWG